MVYGAYGGLFVLSTLAEALIQVRLGRVFRQGRHTASAPACSRFVFTAWLQGQISNLATYAHICFAAASLSCALRLGHEGHGPTSDAVDQDTLRTVFDKSLPGFAACALLAVLAGNARRALYLYRYIRAQPHVHKLTPHGFRNTQLAWVCNFWTTAIFLESTSLSDYMVKLGHPVVAERLQRDTFASPEPRPPRVESIARPLIMDKLKY